MVNYCQTFVWKWKTFHNELLPVKLWLASLVCQADADADGGDGGGGGGGGGHITK